MQVIYFGRGLSCCMLFPLLLGFSLQKAEPAPSTPYWFWWESSVFSTLQDQAPDLSRSLSVNFEVWLMHHHCADPPETALWTNWVLRSLAQFILMLLPLHADRSSAAGKCPSSPGFTAAMPVYTGGGSPLHLHIHSHDIWVTWTSDNRAWSKAQ